jgi:hypothetical protein
MRIKTPKVQRQDSFSGRVLRDESGFTMLLAMGVMAVTALLMAAAFAAADGDIHLTHTDESAKKAYYAAQAGISDYVFHLNQDVDYWTHCSEPSPANPALNQVGSVANTAAVPGSTDEKYAIQLLPANGAPQCSKVTPVGTMIESSGPAKNTFRISSTGFSGGQKRTIVASFKHESFLNFVYYTKYETSDPVTYSPARPACAGYYGTRPASECDVIQFRGGDKIYGPLHTEDKVATCSSPTFGRSPADSIQMRLGFYESCGGAPHFVGTKEVPGPRILPPPSDVALASEADYSYTGRTEVVLRGAQMEVTNQGKTVTEEATGVLYVSGSCSISYTPFTAVYEGDQACGNVYVHGEYTGQLTIGASNDIIIDGNILTPVDGSGNPTTNGVLGLIANNFVRVQHGVSKVRGPQGYECNGAGDIAAQTHTNLTIWAAILAVAHSFIVDNYDCGNELGELHVHGAIAQVFRGAVGTSGGTGYIKDYVYDDRLQQEQPPHFLDPIEYAWHVGRETSAPSP